MSYHIPAEVQDRMLFAVNNFDESFKTAPDGTPRDHTPDTKEFWQAFAEWAPNALVGEFSMTTNTVAGEIHILFTPR